MHAWNYGRRIAEGGHAPPSLTYLDILGPPLVATEAECLAIERLGFDTFITWAVRGWWAAHTERSSA